MSAIAKERERRAEREERRVEEPGRPGKRQRDQQAEEERMRAGNDMDYVVFNGHASQYVENPIPVKVREPIRIFPGHLIMSIAATVGRPVSRWNRPGTGPAVCFVPPAAR